MHLQVVKATERVGRAKEACLYVGAGGKAISFLSLIPEAETIQSVVDVNPNRQGLYTPKSVKRVISPATLRDERPEIIIMSNPVYRSEIELEIQRQGLRCKLVAA